MDALQVLEDYTDKHGLPVWVTEAERVEIWANEKTDKFQAAIDQKTQRKNYKARPGTTFVPEVVVRYGEKPTYSEWLKEQIEKSQAESS